MRIAIPLLLLPAVAMAADDAAFMRCRGMSDPAARLACYDALPVPSAAAPQAATPEQQLQRFGLPRPPDAVDTLDKVESRIPGSFEGWGPNSIIRLENGQAWQVADGSSRLLVLENPKVTIRRGALSAFYLEFEGDNRTVRVRRLR